MELKARRIWKPPWEHEWPAGTKWCRGQQEVAWRQKDMDDLYPFDLLLYPSTTIELILRRASSFESLFDYSKPGNKRFSQEPLEEDSRHTFILEARSALNPILTPARFPDDMMPP